MEADAPAGGFPPDRQTPAAGALYGNPLLEGSGPALIAKGDSRPQIIPCRQSQWVHAALKVRQPFLGVQPRHAKGPWLPL